MPVELRPQGALIEQASLGVQARVRSVVAAELRPLVREIDLSGFYPEAVMRRLGEAGAFAQHHAGLSERGGIDLPAAIEAMSVIAEACGSTAFCTWCQDASGWYLQNTENASLRESLRAGIATGRLLSGTGLSNPMKMLSGIEPIKLTGRRVPGGYEVNGMLPWVSNLGNGHYFAVCFAEAGDEKNLVMALARVGDAGVEIRHNARFLGLEGTATRAVAFKQAFIEDGMVLAAPAEPFARRIRAGFVLLQTGMALGLIKTCVNSMRELAGKAGGTNVFLSPGPNEIEDRLGPLEEDIRRIAATPLENTPAYREAVLRSRLEAAELALAAAQSAMLHAGASGYVEGAAPNRRLREAYFFAILTPAIKHLRKDLYQLR